MSSCGAGVIWGKMLGWLGLTVGKPQGRSLCVWGVASGSAASHPDPGSSGMVELSEESEYPERLRGNDRDFLRSRVADEQDRAVWRQGEASRLSAHGHAGGHAPRLEIDLCHLVGG